MAVSCVAPSAYDAKLEKEVPDGTHVPGRPQGAGWAHSTSGTEISLKDLLAGIKDRGGKTYLQTGQNARKRGAVHFPPDGQAVIQILKYGDASTLIHELGLLHGET